MSGKRWQPPHPDPLNVQPTPASKRRREAETRPSWLPACAWDPCDARPDLKYGVGFCLKHATWIRDTMNAVDQQLAEHKAAEITEAEAKINAGIRLNPDERAPGHIYYLLIDNTIKIGYASNVWSRMRAYPPTAKLLAVEPGTKALERGRHNTFIAHLAWGREWFHDAPELREWISTLVTEYGDPTRMAYTYTTPEKPTPKPVITPRGWTGRKRTAA